MRSKAEIAAYRKRYYEANKPKHLGYTRKRRALTNSERKARYAGDPALRERARAKVKAWKARQNPIALRAKFYGIDADDLERMLDNGCRICTAGRWVDGVKLTVDHDHSTGRVRGVLCESCNFGIGKFYDDPLKLIAAARYLMESSAEALTQQASLFGSERVG